LTIEADLWPIRSYKQILENFHTAHACHWQTDRQTEEKVISIAEGFFSETLAKNIDENY